MPWTSCAKMANIKLFTVQCKYSKAKAKSGFLEFVTFAFLEFDITCDQGKSKNMKC